MDATAPTSAMLILPEEIITPWTDACIRWDGEEGGLPAPRSSSNDDEERPVLDPFADPDPTKEFTFDFTVVDHGDGDNNGTDKQDTNISITVNGYKADSDETWHSTGLTLWKASHHLNAYSLRHYKDWRGLRLLELGAGLGLCGILIDRLLTHHDGKKSDDRPPTTICITDGDTEALAVLRENLHRNGATSTPRTLVQTTCRQLLWGQETAARFLQQSQPSPLLFDLIIASDIIYAPSVLVPLFETLQVLLAPTGVFVLAFAQRAVPVQVDDVVRTATDFGFQLEEKMITNGNETHNSSQYEDGADSGSDKVYLFEVRRRKTP